MTASSPPESSAKYALKQNGHPAVRHLFVEETDQAVIVSGRVSCYYYKQLAQEVLMPIIGLRKLINQVTVQGN